MSSAWKEYQTAEGDVYYYNAETQETSWDKPDELKTADDYGMEGDWVWMPHEVEGYLPARVTSSRGNITYLETEDGEAHEVNTKKKGPLVECHTSSLKKDMDDLVQMDYIDEGMICHNLRMRFHKNIIYTNIGTILISVNPFQRLPLYTPAMMDKYHHKGMRILAPHIFEIADAAYTAMVEEKKNQAILISGESGAGKTEATKQVMAYHAEIAGSTDGIEEKILLCNPILEAFGNAKTLRNNNSSRFGKWIEISYDKNYLICGARIDNYLLEKSRVVYQLEGERSYHIFYMMCKGMDDSQRSAINISDDPFDYHYPTVGQCIDADGIDDVHEYNDMLSAMDKLEFTDEDKGNIFGLTAGVLHLGNIEFVAGDGEGSNVKDTEPLKLAAKMLQVKPEDLEKAIKNRTFVCRGADPVLIPLNPQDAAVNRDALSKKLYGEQFIWLVERINVALKTKVKGKLSFIGVLDIFGFEIFEHNSFEQMCINFANEKLQQHFNNHTFKLEEQLYKSEGIQYNHVDFIDNQPVLDLIEKKPTGILSTCDEEVVMPKGDDKSFLQKLHNKHDKKHPNYKKPIRPATAFIIIHYAGEVMYDSTGYLVKNRDTLQEDLLNLVKSSKSKYITGLCANEGGGTKNRKATLGTQFKGQLNALMATLGACAPNYVRCIKPNSDKLASQFDGMMSLLQLRYAGVFEAVTIRKTGFPFRYTHAEFMKRYNLLDRFVKGKTPLDQCKALLKTLKGDWSEVRVGKSRMLYRATEHRKLELLRNVQMEKRCIVLQAACRGHNARDMAALMIQCDPKLKQAIKSRKLEPIEKALKEASGISFRMRSIAQAEKLRDQILEEMRITKAMEDLQDQDPEDNYEEMKNLVEQADDIEFDSRLVKKIRKLVEEVTVRRKCRADLKEGAKNFDKELLEPALEIAEKLSIKGPEVKKAKEALARIKEEEKIIAELEEAFTYGFMTDGDYSTCDPSGLEAAAASAKKFEMRTAAGKELEAQANATIAMRYAIQSEDWSALGVAIKQAMAANMDAQELADARAELAQRAAMDDVVEALEAAIDDMGHDELSMSLEQAAALGMMDTEHYELVAEAQYMLDGIVEVRQYLTAGVQNVDEQNLVYGVQLAEGMDYEKEEVTRARELRDSVQYAKGYCQEALRVCERNLLEEALNQSDQINLKTDEVAEVRRLLKLDLVPFLEHQRDVVVGLKDMTRIVRVNIQIKDEYFKKNGTGQFAFDKFPGLRPPDLYAKASKRIFSKTKVAEGMCKHDNKTLPTSLTRLEDPDDLKNAKSTFKNILGYCGDKKMTDPQTLGQDTMQRAIGLDKLRDETYAQVMKQCSANPNPESERKAWELMQCAVQAFPASDAFTNYVEVFLREKAKPTNTAKQGDYLKWYHATKHSGPNQGIQVGSCVNTARPASVNSPATFNYSAPPAADPIYREPAPKAQRGLAGAAAAAMAEVEEGGDAPATAPAAGRGSGRGGGRGGRGSGRGGRGGRASGRGGRGGRAARGGGAPKKVAKAAPKKNQCKAMYDYEAADTDEISFAEGDIIDITDDSDDSWWRGELNGASGVFPANFVEKI